MASKEAKEEAPAERQILQQRRSRLETGARSRSRGRTPSEILARKQQLLDQQLQQQQQAQDPEQDPINHKQQNSPMHQSAEAKLESLSVLLKNHQVSSSDSSQDETAQDARATKHPDAPQEPQKSASSKDELYILLAKKEKDLQLAAELGKVLLERNEELSRANEKITEEYSHKLEVSSYAAY